MRNDELTLKLARSARVTPAEAADQLDIVVHDILRKLRQGKPATLPGLGILTPDNENKIRFTGVGGVYGGAEKAAGKGRLKSAAKSPAKAGRRK